MRYTTDTDYPFDTDNRAWRRFTRVLGDHFDVLTGPNRTAGPF